jgi:uncharacterized protein
LLTGEDRTGEFAPYSMSDISLPTDASDVSPRPSVPTADVERIISMDVLRGFALLGILLMNIQSFAMVDAAYANPTATGELQGGDYWAWLLTHLFADQKFMTIFSMLFGAGIAMMAARQQANGRSPAALHYRRMGWLMVIGLLHAYLLWDGDILVTYAICGAGVFVLRKLPCWLLMVLGMLSLCVPSAILSLCGLVMPYLPEEAVQPIKEEWSPSADRIEQETAIFRGSWAEQLPRRAQMAFYTEVFGLLFYIAWRVGGLMLIGMALFRWGVWTGKRSSVFYASLIAAGLLLGLPLVGFGVHQNFAANWSVQYSLFLGSQYNYWGSLLVSGGYVGLVMTVCRFGRLDKLLWPLAAVGQMALTNYLLQSIICTTIFYGHGLGQFERFSRVDQLLTVAAIWTFQLATSPLWLRYFRFGPFEWLWRSLSYGRLQPMLRSGLELAQ